MAHIKLQEGVPGIMGPMLFSPATANPLNELAEILLRGANTLTPAEREMIATYVSAQNDCYFCQTVHGAVAAHHLGGNEKLIEDLKRDFATAAVSDKMNERLPRSLSQRDRTWCLGFKPSFFSLNLDWRRGARTHPIFEQRYLQF